MSSILKYFQDIKAQKQINNWAQQLKNKKVVIYGAGKYFEILNENYDLSKLNIIGICDRKFKTSKKANTTKYKTLTPDDLLNYDFDIALVALFNDTGVIKSLENKLLKNSIIKQIEPIVEPNLWYSLKVLLGLNKTN